jgi:hypothetical protein
MSNKMKLIFIIVTEFVKVINKARNKMSAHRNLCFVRKYNKTKICSAIGVWLHAVKVKGCEIIHNDHGLSTKKHTTVSDSSIRAPFGKVFIVTATLFNHAIKIVQT